MITWELNSGKVLTRQEKTFFSSFPFLRHPCENIVLFLVRGGGVDIFLRGFLMKFNSEREKRVFLVFSFLRYPCAKIVLSLHRVQRS